MNPRHRQNSSPFLSHVLTGDFQNRIFRFSTMTSAFVILAALGCAEAFGLAEMISNYAKVSTNREGTINNETKAFKTVTAIQTTDMTTRAIDDTLNDTYYEDFDDLEESTDQSLSRQTTIDTGTMLKYFNGLVNMLALMYKFTGKPDFAAQKAHFSVGEKPDFHPRYQSDAASKNFKAQTDLEYQPISNFPPYNPLTANAADSYSKNKLKTSYDADVEEFKPGKMSMSDYMIQNAEPSNAQSPVSYGGSPKPMKDETWNEIPQGDYTSHKDQMWTPSKLSGTWRQKKPEVTGYEESESKHSWLSSDDLPQYQQPNKKPIDYQDYVIVEDNPEELHHHLVEDEDRVSKRPYSYYFLGRKLWYVPLIFSVYFIIYIGALVLKSVARHKIQFPEKLWDLKDEHLGFVKHRRNRKIDQLTEKYENAIDGTKNKFI